jgi:hypothetical protein
MPENQQPPEHPADAMTPAQAEEWGADATEDDTAPAAFAPLSADEENLCNATNGICTCLAAPGHPGDHAAYGVSPTVPVHTWPQLALVSEVGTLTPQEMATLHVARARVTDDGGLGILPSAHARKLIAIIDRLSGITAGGEL